MKKYIYVLSAAICLIGCKKYPAPSADYMVLDKVVFVDKFPETFTLGGGTPLDLGLIGTVSMAVHDSLLITTTSETQGFWQFFSLPEFDTLGRYLSRGRGPGEFVGRPIVADQYFFKDGRELFSILYDYSNGKTHKMNITETLRDGKLSMAEVDMSLPRYLDRVQIDTATIFCIESNDRFTQSTRYILRNGEKHTSANFGKLDLATKPDDASSGTLSIHAGVSPDGKRIVEAPLYLNHINLYSLDDSFGKTICVGSEIDNISRIQEIARADRKWTYMDLNAYPEFFGALYLNDTDANYEQGKSPNPVIQLFDWNGKPLAEIKTDRMITTWDIDFTGGTLYTLNYHTEEMYRYDIGEILNEITN